ADVVDAKDPARGALGPVRLDRLAAIRRAVGAARPVSAALGDARDDASAEAAAATAAGLAFVKLGFGGITSEAQAQRLARAARGAELVGVRGAACIGGRRGRVSRDRVAALRRLVRAAPALSVGALP